MSSDSSDELTLWCQKHYDASNQRVQMAINYASLLQWATLFELHTPPVEILRNIYHGGVWIPIR